MTHEDQAPKRVSTTVPLDWNEVWFTNCPMVSANNVDQELGWCREEYKKIGVEYAYFRSANENNFYPHYIHNLDNLVRFGGLYPPIHGPRRHPPHGAAGGDLGLRGRLHGGPRSRPDLPDAGPQGQEDRLTKSQNTIKNDWWRIQEHMGIENMLRLNDMTMDDIELVEFPYPDDWYDKPEMLVVPMNNPSELWMRRDHKHDYAFRPLEKALLDGTSTPSTPRARLPASPGGDGQDRHLRGPVDAPGLADAGRQHPGRHHLHRRHGRASIPSWSSPT